MLNLKKEDFSNIIKGNKIIITVQKKEKTVFRIIQFKKIDRMSRDNKEVAKFLSAQSEVAAACYDSFLTFGTFIKHSEMFNYGFFTITESEDIFEVENLSEKNIFSLERAYRGSFKQLGISDLSQSEVTEMINLISNQYSQFACLVGIAQPKHSKTGVSKDNPFGEMANQAESQMEEFVKAIGAREYLFINLIQPLPPEEGIKYLKNIETLQGDIEKDAEYGLNMGVSVTLPMGWNTGGNENITDGWSYGTNNSWNDSFSDSWGANINENFSVGEGWSVSDSLALSNSISETAGVNQGNGWNTGLSTNENWGINENYGISNSDTVGFNFSQGYTEGDTLGETYGTSRNGSFSNNFSENYSLSNSISENTNMGLNLSRGTSWSGGTNDGISDSYGFSGNTGSNKGFGFNENMGFNENGGFSLNKNGGVSHAYSGTASFGDTSSQQIGLDGKGNLPLAQVGAASNLNSSINNGITHNFSLTNNAGDGAGYNTGAGYNEGQGLSENIGKSWGIGENANSSYNTGRSLNWAINDSLGSSLGLGRAVTLGYTGGIGYSGGVTYGEGENDSLSYSKNTSNSVTNGSSWSQAFSENIGKGKNQGIGISESQGLNTSWGNSLSLASSDSASHTKSLGTTGNISNGWGRGENIGKSYTAGKSTGDNEGVNFSWGKGTQWGMNTGISPAINVGINKTIRNYDLKRFAEILNNYRIRLSIGLKKGIFLTQSFLITYDELAYEAGKKGLVSALTGDTPFRIQTMDMDKNKENARNKIMNFELMYDEYEENTEVRKYKFITIEDAESLAAKSHIPRIDYGGLALTESYPACRVRYVPEAADTIELGNLIIPEEGGVTEKKCRIVANRAVLNHGIFSGITGSGKSETVKTFIAELAKLKVDNYTEVMQRGGSEFLASGIIFDWKKDHRGLLTILPRNRRAFYTIGNKINPLKQNLMAVPPGVTPFEHFSSIGEAFCLANQLAGKSSTMIYSNCNFYCSWGEEVKIRLADYKTRLLQNKEMILKNQGKAIREPIKMISTCNELLEGLNKLLAFENVLTSIEQLNSREGILELKSKFNKIPTKDEIIASNSRYITFEHLYYVMEIEKIFKKADGIMQTDLAEAYDRLTERFKQFKDDEILNTNFCYNFSDQIFITQLLEEDRWVIIESEKIKSNNELKKFIIYTMTADIYNYACNKDSKGDKFNNIKCIFFEEAAEILPTREGNSGKQVLDVTQDIYEKIFSQGRGYGLRCYAVVQNIHHLKETIIACSPTSFFMRTNKPEDMDTIVNQFGKVHTMDLRDVEFKKILPHLPTGEVMMKNSAVVNELGDAEPFIFKCKMTKMHVPTDQELINLIEKTNFTNN